MSEEEKDEFPTTRGDHLRVVGRLFNPVRCFWTMFRRNETRTMYSGYEILDFLRSMSVLWVICLHQENQWLLQAYFDKEKFAEEEVLWWNGFIWMGHFSVDLFLLISGFLIGMIIIREQRKYQRRVDLKRFGWRRFMRIYPLLLVNFGVYYCAEVYLLQGATQCQDNWWATLFFVNNIPQIIDYPDTCMLWTWSLALEMQFYVIISILLWATANKLKVQKALCWAILIGSMALRLGISIDVGATFPPPISEFGGDNRWSFELYIPAYTRIGNLFIGVLTALYELDAKIADEEKAKEVSPEEAADGIVEKEENKVIRYSWLLLRLVSLAIVTVFPLVNWSAVLDEQCEFASPECSCGVFIDGVFKDIPVKRWDEFPGYNESCSDPIEVCGTFLRLSDKCQNTTLPYWFQIFLLASYRTIFCGAWGVLVYHVLTEAKKRRELGLEPKAYVKFCAWRIWFMIAQISYGMYLWNQIIIYVVQLVAFEGYFVNNWHVSFGWKVLVLLTCTVATIAMSVVTYIIVEKPFMDIRDYNKFLTQVKADRREKEERMDSGKVITFDDA